MQNERNFQRYSVKRRQAWSDREVRVTLERSEKKNTKKHPCPVEQAQFSAFFRQTEASRKRARRVSHAWKEQFKKERQNQLYPVPTPIVQAIFPRHWRRLQQTWFYVEATFSPKKWRLQVNICFYASETYKKVIYLNVNKSLQLFWCFKCVCGQVL